jgi:hypothetical protein
MPIRPAFRGLVASLPPTVSPGSGFRSADFTSARPVENTPHEQVIAEALESMLGFGRHEKQVARLEWITAAIVKENATPANRDVKLILVVWRLLIRTRWCP